MEDKLKAEAVYIAAAVNRFPKCAAIDHKSSVIAFGSHNLVALWKLDVSAIGLHNTLSLGQVQNHSEAAISQVLLGHDAKVTCVQFLDSETILSGDENGHIVVRVQKDQQVWIYGFYPG